MPKILEDCVKQVGKTKSKSSSYAICTASLQKAGEMPKAKQPSKGGKDNGVWY